MGTMISPQLFVRYVKMWELFLQSRIEHIHCNIHPAQDWYSSMQDRHSAGQKPAAANPLAGSDPTRRAYWRTATRSGKPFGKWQPAAAILLARDDLQRQASAGLGALDHGDRLGVIHADNGKDLQLDVADGNHHMAGRTSFLNAETGGIENFDAARACREQRGG
jgi:hypothetical protein